MDLYPQQTNNDINTNLLHLHAHPDSDQSRRQKQKDIEDEFDIIEDADDQALISYYNDTPSQPTNVPITDKVR